MYYGEYSRGRQPGSELEHLVRDTVNLHGKMDTAAGEVFGYLERDAFRQGRE